MCIFIFYRIISSFFYYSGEANVTLGRQKLLWGGKLALGRQTCSGEKNLLWEVKCCSKLLWGSNLLWGESVRKEMLLWEANLLWGKKVALRS